MNKRATIGMKQVLGILLFLILFFIIFKMTSDGTSKVSDSSTSLVESLLGKETDFITINTLLDAPVPDKLLEYTHTLSKQLFSDPDFTNYNSLYLVDSFEDYPTNSKLKKEYEDFRLIFSYSEHYKNPGIVVIIFNEDTEQYLEVDNPDDSAYLRGKHVCVLPGKPDSFSIASAIVNTLYNDYSMEHSTMHRSDISEEGTTESVSLYFGEQNSGYSWFNVFQLSDFSAIKLSSDGKSIPIFGYGSKISPIPKFPIYVTRNTLCFFQMGLGDDATGTGKSLVTNIQGMTVSLSGPLWWESHKHLVAFINKEG